MSGHSKWSQIKHKKAVTDAKKSKMFTKASSLITIAVREKTDANPSTNAKLALAIEKAREINMPQDNIKRAIERAKGMGAGENLDTLRYEAYGPYSVAFVIDAISDNKNRTLAEIKFILSKHSGKFAAVGSVVWMFEEKGEIEVTAPSLTEKQELELIESGVEDIQKLDDITLVSCAPSSLENIKKKMNELKLPYTRAESLLAPKESVALTEEQKKEIIILLELLDDQNEVVEVYTNAEL